MNAKGKNAYILFKSVLEIEMIVETRTLWLLTRYKLDLLPISNEK